MQQISTREFERLPLRVHFLAGVPLHGVWAVDLPLTLCFARIRPPLK